MPLEQLFSTIYEHYLRRPYPDVGDDAFRGSYMLRTGRVRPYPLRGDPETIAQALYRMNYGMAYTVRFVSDIRGVASLMGYFDPLSLQKLEITAGFLTVGKKTDCVLDSAQAVNREQLYEDAKKSAEIFAEFARSYKSLDKNLLFSSAEIDHYQSVLLGVCSTKKTMEPFVFCQAMQFMRDLESLSFFQGKTIPAKMLPLLKKSEIKIILTGESQKACFDSRENKFIKTNTLRRLALFHLVNTNLSICSQVIALSDEINSNAEAEAFATVLNLYAIDGSDALLAVLEEINNTFYRREKILTLIDRHAHELDCVDDARLIKTVKINWWKNFKKTLIRPGTNRPELRKEDRPLSHTLRLAKDASHYEVVSTQKGKRPPRFHLTEKLERTRHQAVTLTNWKKGLNPPPFQTGSLYAISIGISVPCADTAFARIAIYNPYRVSYARCYDYPTEARAKKAIDLGLASGNLHLSINDLQKQELTKNLNRLSEIDAYLKWQLTEKYHITIFNDNIKSRLFAQLCAADFK